MITLIGISLRIDTRRCTTGDLSPGGRRERMSTESMTEEDAEKNATSGYWGTLESDVMYFPVTAHVL